LVARNAVIAAAVTSRFATYQASQQPGATTAGRSAAVAIRAAAPSQRQAAAFRAGDWLNRV